MATNSALEFTKSDDELLLYSYGLFSSGKDDISIDCIPWIANKFPHHSLEEWNTRFAELKRGLSSQELSELADRVANEFDIGEYGGALQKRGIEPHVDESLSDEDSQSDEPRANTTEPTSQTVESPTPDHVDSHVISSDDDDDDDDDNNDNDILKARPSRAKRGPTTKTTSTPELSEAQIKAQVDEQLSAMGVGFHDARARQSRNYIEQELGRVSLVHHQLGRLKSELTKKLNDLDRGLGYGGFLGKKPAPGFWGNDGSANGGADDPVVSETDAIMTRFWDAYQGRKEPTHDSGSSRGQKRGFVAEDDNDEQGRSVKKMKNGNGRKEDEGRSREGDSSHANDDPILGVDISREESRELEESILAESDSDLSELPSDVEISDEELDTSSQNVAELSNTSSRSNDDSYEEAILKPVPKNFKVGPPPASQVEEEEEEESVDEQDSLSEEGEESSDSDESHDEVEEDESPVTTTKSRRRSAGKPNYREIPPDFDEEEEEEEEEASVEKRTRASRARIVSDSESEEEEEEEELEAPVEKRTRTSRARARVVSDSESEEDDESESADESDEEVTSAPKRGQTRGRLGRARGRNVEEDDDISDDEEQSDSEADEEQSNSEVDRNDAETAEPEKKPPSFTDLFHAREKNRVSLFSDSDSDRSSGSDSDEFVEIVAVPKNQPKPRKRIGPVTSLASRGRARGRARFESSSSDSSDSPELDDDSDDDVSESG